MIAMMTISLCVNLAVLALVIPQLWIGAAGMTQAFGPDSTARQILICVYAAIWLISLGGVALLAAGQTGHAYTLCIGLLAMQVLYKLATVVVIGLKNPVVATNLPIALLHVATLAVMLSRP